MSHKSGLHRVLEGIDQNQRATTFPETLRAGRSVDEFLWKGDPKAPLIQRVGLFIFASMFLSLFVGLIVVIVVMIIQRDWLNSLWVLVVATLSGIAGFRFLFNAFRRQKHHRAER